MSKYLIEFGYEIEADDWWSARTKAKRFIKSAAVRVPIVSFHARRIE